MGGVDQKMCQVSFFLDDGEWVPQGGLDVPTTRCQIGMYFSTVAIHPCRGCPRCKHDPWLLMQPIKGIPDLNCSSGYSSSAIWG